MVKTMRVAVALAALTVMSLPAFAQGGGGGRQGGGGFGGGFGGGQFGRGGQNGELTTVQIPVATLTTVAKLTPEQATKVKAMQDKLDEQRKAARPQFGGAGGGQRPSQEEMQQLMEEMRAKQEQIRNDETKASKAIDAMLSADQSAALKAALPGLKAAASFGLMAIYADLNLTEAQVAVLVKAAKERQAQMQQGPGRRGGGN